MTSKLQTEIARLRELREKAAKGPWHFNKSTEHDDGWELHVEGDFICESANRWLSLLESLEVAVIALTRKDNAHAVFCAIFDEEYYGVTNPCTCENKNRAEALAKIEQLICGDNK